MRVRTSQQQSPPDLDNWLADVDPNFLNCRRFGHAWVEWRYQARPAVGVLSRTTLRCTRCQQKAFDDLDYSGYNTRQIQYDDDYLAPVGMGHLSTDDRAKLRLESERRRVVDMGDVQEGAIRSITGNKRRTSAA